MKYIILGKNNAQGIVGNDSSDLSEYFELGWESVGSRIDFISLVNQKLINEEEYTAVTIKDRMFMYTSFFKNVISYEEFSKKNISKNDIIDWTLIRNFNFLDANKFVDLKTQKYIRHEEDYNEIFNGFTLNENLHQEEKFIVVCIRHRDHCSYRNSDVNFYKLLIKKLKLKIKNIFVVGKGNEEFCLKNNCFYVEKLQDYVTLIKNKNCAALVSQATGTVALSFTSATCPIYMIDHSKVSDLEGNNAVLGGKCIQFCSKPIKVFFEINQETIDKIFDNIV